MYRAFAAEHREWDLTPLELGGLGSYALVGMLIGAMVIGTLSDRIGRRRMLLVSMAIFTTMQLGAALAPTPEVFGLFRLLGGLGMGGIIPVAAALTIEYSAPRRRSFNYGVMYSGYSLGILAAALVAIVLLPTLGWRWVVGVGFLPVVLLPLVARLLPESLEYLMGKGRREEAARLAERLHVAPFVEGDWTPVRSEEAKARSVGWKQSLAAMFSGGYLTATVFFWVSLFPDVAVSSRLHGSVRVKRRVVHGDNQQLNLAIHRAELFNQFQSALARQSDIHQHQLRLDTANGPQGLFGVAGFTAYRQVFLMADYPHQRLAKSRVVLDNEYPSSRCGTWLFKPLFTGFLVRSFRGREF